MEFMKLIGLIKLDLLLLLNIRLCKIRELLHYGLMNNILLAN